MEISSFKGRTSSSCCRPSSKWLTITQNINLGQNEAFQFVDVFDHLPPDQNTNQTSLRVIYDLLSVKLSDSRVDSQTSLVILDDIASLEWLGFSLLDLSRFARALRSLCVKVSEYYIGPPLLYN